MDRDTFVVRGRAAACALVFLIAATTAFPRSAVAVTYTVCVPGPVACDFDSPEAAVNDPIIADSDVIDIQTDTYVLTQTIQVDDSITINGNGSTIDGDGAFRIEVGGTGVDAEINDLTMRNGIDPVEGVGGGIVVSNGANATINGATLEDNNSGGPGGGLAVANGTASVNDSVIRDNRSGGRGGGVHVAFSNSVLNLTRVTIEGNRSFAAGGGVHVDTGATVNIVESTISGNVAVSEDTDQEGGAFTGTTLGCGTPGTPGNVLGQTFTAGVGVLTAFSIEVRRNTAGADLPISGRVYAGSGVGGTLLGNASGTLPGPAAAGVIVQWTLDFPVVTTPGQVYTFVIDKVDADSVYTVREGTAYAGGDRVACLGGVIAGSDLVFETSGGDPGEGGGIFAGGFGPSTIGTINLTNSTVSNNIGDGGYANEGGAINTVYSTIVNNGGNGLTAEAGDPGGVLTFEGTILADNAGLQCSANDLASFATSNDFNLISDINGCTLSTPGPGSNDQLGGAGIPVIDPQLGPLQDNGGPTFTHLPAASSPTVDAGGTSCTVATDQRGIVRPQEAGCEIGAVEIALATPLQDLIDAAAPGAIIDVPDGTYTETIVIGDGKTLRGSGPAGVIIDATGQGGPAITGGTGDFALEGIRITGGLSNTQGGAIALDALSARTVTLTDVVLDNNEAANQGGAIGMSSGNSLVGTSVTFSSNTTTSAGGAIYANGSVDLQGATFENNSAAAGGAIFIDVNGTLELGVALCVVAPGAVTDPVSNLFTGNTATAGSGGAILGSGNLVIADARFTMNSALGGGAVQVGAAADFKCSIFDSNDATLGDGGAISGSASIETSLFEANTAAVSGGAIAGDVAISDSDLRSNSAGSSGGAIGAPIALVSSNNAYTDNQANRGGAIAELNDFAVVLLSDNDVFSGNAAKFDGGAIDALDLAVTDGTFVGNEAGDLDINTGNSGDGGAIFGSRNVTITGSLFTDNTALELESPARGGAIYNDGAMVIVDSTIELSNASIGGGVYSDDATDTLTISGSTFASNTANNSGATAGGGIGGAGVMDIVNSTFSGNSADGRGGAFGLTAGTATFNNSTFFDNSSDAGGAHYGDAGSLILLSNNVFLQNIGGGATNCATTISAGHNIYVSSPCPTLPTDIVGADALLGPLADNGGPTQTHALQPGSPAQDAGGPDAISFPLFDSGNVGDWQFNGFTSLDGNALLLAAGNTTVGSAYLNDPVDVTQDFSARFQFQMTPSLGNPADAADGITFSIVADPSVLGDTGNALGIAEFTPTEVGVVEGVSIEFDTWTDDGGLDGNQDHVGIDIDGEILNSPEVFIGPNGTFATGTWTVWVDYDATIALLEVRVANDGIRPALATIEQTGLSIAQFSGNSAFIGFTGATGFEPISGEHRILNFEFSGPANCEPTDQRGIARPQGGACDSGAYEADSVPLALGAVSLTNDLDLGETFPGVVDVPIIDIPIEKLTGDSLNEPESAPLGAFPIGAFPIGAFDIQNSPIGAFPIGAFPIGAFSSITSAPIGAFPLGAFSLSSIPLLREGGWPAVLDTIPELAGSPPQTVTLDQIPQNVLDDILLKELAVDGSPLASLSLPGLSLGDNTVATLDQWAQNDNPTASTVCATLQAADPGFTDCSNADTLFSLEIKGAPVEALSLSSLPLGAFPIGAFPIGAFPIGAFPIGAFPLGAFPIGAFDLASLPIGAFDIQANPIGAFPIGAFDLLASPIDSIPIGAFPIGAFPIGAFEIEGQSFCEFYDANANSTDTPCADLVDPNTATLLDVVAELANEGSSNIGSTPLGAFPIGAFPIGAFPLGAFDLATLSSPPLSFLTLADFGGCDIIDCAAFAALDDSSTLADVANEFGGTLQASPLGAFPIEQLGIADLPLGAFPIGAFEINGLPIGAFPLSYFDIVSSPLGAFPIGAFPAIIDDPTGVCSSCTTLAQAWQAGVVNPNATLSDLSNAPTFNTTTLGEVLGSLSLEFLYGPGTMSEIEDTGDLTFGQLIVALMLKTDFPWETIPLGDLEAQEFSADNFVEYRLNFALTGTQSEPFDISLTIDDGFMYEPGSSMLDVTPMAMATTTTTLPDPTIVDNGDGSQTLTFPTTLLGGFSDNTIRFNTVAPLDVGDFPASAEVTLGAQVPVAADASAGLVTVIPDPATDASNPSAPAATPRDVLLLGFIDSADDNDFYQITPPNAGDRVAVFMANPGTDNDLLMYEPLTSVEAKGQNAESPPLDSVPFEDDGVTYEGNLTEEPNALEDVNLAAAPLASISTNRGDLEESVAAIAGNTDPFTIQVSGYNGSVSDQPYTLRVKVTPAVVTPLCTARPWPGTQGAQTVFASANPWTANTNAVFLVNWDRLAASDPGGAAAADAALTAINALVEGPAPGIVDGVVVDVSTIGAVDYSTWDANPCDVDAANSVVNAITRYLEVQRASSPNLTYVTIAGSDEVIPFLRKPDETSIANESTFAGEQTDNALFGALVTRHFLSDDTYGDVDPIAWLDRFLNVPEIAVGRLVESAVDIEAAANAYVTSGGLLNPASAISVGYDFIADAALDIDNTFDLYGPELGYLVQSPLIDDPATPAANPPWNRNDFLNAVGVTGVNPIVDLVSFNGHFDFDEMLPSEGDATGDLTNDLVTVSDLASANLLGGLWYTVGCHSGTNVPDIAVSVGPSQDWAQTMASRGAVYAAQTGYGLGDTVTIALSERLMANFTRNLDGSLSIGQAHAFAKQQYFADLGLYGEYDYKAIQEVTLYGLPMYRFGNGEEVDEPLPPLPIETDPVSGLMSASLSVPNTGITQTATEKGALFSVGGRTQLVHYRPIQPIIGLDVTGPAGEVARGAFLTGLVTQDIQVADIAFARPVIDLGAIEPEVETDEVAFPTAFTNLATYKAPLPGGGPLAPRQQLNVIVGQFTSPLDGQTNGTERLFNSVDLQVFYQNNASDFTRPEFDNVQAGLVGPAGARQASFSLQATDSVGAVQRVSVLYRRSVSGTDGIWEMVDLVEGGGNTWTGGGPVDESGLTNGEVDYMVQAVDSNGNVANSTFKGLFYVAEEIPMPPDPGGGPGNIGVVITDPTGNELDPDDWITEDPVEVEITDQDPTVDYEYSIDFGPFVPLTMAGFEITGDGVHFVTVREVGGGNPITFTVLIDTTDPVVIITSPVEGQYVVQTMEPLADYVCFDSGSGVASCDAPVPDGTPVPSSPTGDLTFEVTAVDDAGFDASAVVNYTAVKALELMGPTDTISIGQLITVSGSATDIDGVTETATIDWGDGTVEPLTLTANASGELEFSADHEYTVVGSYTVTVSVDFGGEFVQQESLGITMADPVGLWAQGDDPKNAIEIGGSDLTVDGVVHSNGGIKIGGNGHVINGVTRYVDVLKGDNKATFSEPPAQVDPAVWPFAKDVADYQPGGAAALAAGASFFDKSAECADEDEWEIDGDDDDDDDDGGSGNTLLPGLYWVPCDVDIEGGLNVSQITIVATGDIKISGSGTSLSPFSDNVLFWSESDDDKDAIKVSGSNSTFGGFLFAPNGGIKVSGNDHDFGCGLAAQKIKVSGSDHNVGQNCTL